MKEDLKWIKKHYSEKMMHLCRTYLSTLLETPKLLPSLLDKYFHQSKTLAEDILNEHSEDDFKNYIYSKIDVEKKEITEVKSPYELFKEASYTLYHCNNYNEIMNFTKYYISHELLCTFYDIESRLERCHIFFAVKDNAENILRKDIPNRQDEYGTSVMSIQFSKGINNDVSIKNRYNHSVNNPDATFSNNLDNIVEGLTSSFENEYGFKINNESINFELKGYVRGPDKKIYKYNNEINGIYYCPDNIIIKHGKIIKYEKEKYILIENYLLNLVNKTITNLDDASAKIDKSFCKSFENIEKIKIEKNGNYKIIYIKNYDEEEFNVIKINKNNEMIALYLPNTTIVGDDFLKSNKTITSIDMPKTVKTGKRFLFSNKLISVVNMPLLEEAGSDYLFCNRGLIILNLPKLKIIKDDFLFSNLKLTELFTPLVEIIGNYFLYKNKNLKYIESDNIIKVGSGFLEDNEILTDYKKEKNKNLQKK